MLPAFRISAVLSALLLACSLGETVEPPASGGVLFIGNSLTYQNDLPGIVAALGDSSGQAIEVRSVAAPNYGLLDHWNDGSAVAAIRAGRYDVVVMQQGPSSLAASRAELIDYAGRFATEIRARGGRPALYGVWPDKSRLSFFDDVSESYRLAAVAVQGTYLPAGEGWRAAWRRDSTLALYDLDDFHPSALGSYEAALVIYQRLTGRSPVGLPARLRTPAGTIISVAPATALLLQQAAAEANLAFPDPPAAQRR